MPRSLRCTGCKQLRGKGGAAVGAGQPWKLPSASQGTGLPLSWQALKHLDYLAADYKRPEAAHRPCLLDSAACCTSKTLTNRLSRCVLPRLREPLTKSRRSPSLGWTDLRKCLKLPLPVFPSGLCPGNCETRSGRSVSGSCAPDRYTQHAAPLPGTTSSSGIQIGPIPR